MPFSIAVAVFWAAVVACAVAQLAILAPVLRRHQERPLVEVAWAVGPSLVLALIFTWTWHAMRAGHAAPGATLGPVTGTPHAVQVAPPTT